MNLLRCICQVGYVRPPGSDKCLQIATPAPKIITEKVTLTTEALSLISKKPDDECDLDVPDSCPRKGEVCQLENGLFVCVCGEGLKRNLTTKACEGCFSQRNYFKFRVAFVMG